ncbi:MAG: hypothetical protein QNJ13_15835 [Paracoccaceae bacterium]|nr:hypothetical protein [Paracoccaceae bacterium]
MQCKVYVVVPEPAPHEPRRTAPTEAEAFRDRLSQLIGTALEGAGVGRAAGTAKVTARFGAETGRAEAFTLVGDDPMAEPLVRAALAAAPDDTLGRFGLAAVFEVDDFMVAESLIWDVAHKAGLQDSFVLHPMAEEAQPAPSEAGAYKSIEVYYNIDAIPAGYSHPLDFRNEAMSLVERALEDAGAGEWAGAEIGMGEVNFGFEVEDFERAEKIVRAAVKGTPFEGIREITRFSYPEDTVALH